MTPTCDLIAATSRRPRPREAELFPRLSLAKHEPYWEREDPFFDDWLWGGSPRFEGSAVRRRRSDGSRIVARNAVDRHRTDGKRLWRTTQRSAHIHRLLTLLAQLSYATSKQATCWGGWYGTNRTRYLQPPRRLGLTRRGTFDRDLLGGSVSRLWRVDPDGPWRAWLRQAGDDVAAAVSGDGSGPKRPGEHARHDVLAVEVALRLLETQPRWVAVSGEADANLAALTGDPTYPTHLRGDLVLWRDDGLRVIVELTASADPRHLSRKIAAWGRAVARRTLAETGTIVVLLNAVSDGHYAAATRLRRLHERQLDADTVRDPAGVVLAPDELRSVRAMIHLASWADWFPLPRRVGPHGRHAATTTSIDGQHWHELRLADPDLVEYQPLRDVDVPTPPRGSLLTPWWAGNDRDWHTGDETADPLDALDSA